MIFFSPIFVVGFLLQILSLKITAFQKVSPSLEFIAKFMYKLYWVK